MWFLIKEFSVWARQKLNFGKTISWDSNLKCNELNDANGPTAGPADQADSLHARLVHVNIPIRTHRNDSQY